MPSRAVLTLAVAAATLVGIVASFAHGTARAARADLPICTGDAAWRCGNVSVPLDRANPAAGSIRIAFYVSPHTGSGRALEPIFITPGGPGESGWAKRFFYEKAPQLSVHHDLVLIDPTGNRSVGRDQLPRPAERLSEPHGVPHGRRQLRGDSSALRPTDTARATWPSTSRTCAKPSATTGSTTTRSRTARCPSRATQHGSRNTFTRSRSTPGWSPTTAGSSTRGVSVCRKGLMRIERLAVSARPVLSRRRGGGDPVARGPVQAHPVKGRRIVVDEIELINLLSPWR